MKTLTVVEEVVTETRLAPSDLWAIVSDTDRVNREAGLAPMTLVPAAGRGAVRYIAETVIGPFRVGFEELPFEWTAPERLVIRRRMTRGPARSIVVRFDVSATPDGATVRTRIEVELAARRWRPAGAIVARWVAQRLDRAVRQLSAEQPPATSSARTPTTATRDAWATRMTEETSSPWADALVRHVFDAEDHELVRIRPYELARAWTAEPRAVLETCLAATVSGLLNLSWDLVCPSCRTSSSRGSSLEGLGSSAHCEQCDLTFGLDLDRAVEATFHPSRSVRVVDDVRFCSGGPAMTPHVVAQRVLEPGAPVEFEVPQGQVRLRLFARGGATARVELVDAAPQRVEVMVDGTQITPAAIEVAPGGVITARLGDAEGRHVKLERLEWASTAATAHDVSLIPQFRERFSGEVLKPGLALAVSRVALLFSDLGASTALYTQSGDAVAFRLVHDHFELVRAVITERGGTIVKTIGDAVMAAFSDEKAALSAACDMSAAFPAFREARPFASSVSLKLGMYAGPCYVVEANGILDYFGQTVNVAARLQGQARDDELVITQGLWAQAQDEAWVGHPVAVVELLDATLKGITGTVPVVRLRVSAAPATTGSGPQRQADQDP